MSIRSLHSLVFFFFDDPDSNKDNVAVKVQLSWFMCADWSSHPTTLFIYKKYERCLDQTTNALYCCPSVS